MRGWALSCLVASVGAFGPGCGPDERLPPTPSGELVNGDFVYACIDATDRRCDTETFPQFIGVGSTFGIDFSYFDTSKTDTPTLEPAAAGLTKVGAEQFVMDVAGFTAILALNDAGEVVDLFHVRGEAPTGVAVLQQIDEAFKGVNTISVVPGGTTELRAQTQNAAGEALAGALTYEWSIADESVATLAPGEASSFVTLQAGPDEAMTTLTVAAAGLEVTVEVDVTLTPDTGTGDGTGTGTGTGDGGSDTGDSGGTSGTGTGTGTGTDTGTGTGSATTSGGGTATTSGVTSS